ncbi:hypothetical protein OVN18_02345 [Microcella daejeonensis]|uniref:YfhO family protein n=1 Tax=Microcella daejeonensis TaxID=2994971 RepID=A0A9E8MLS8_9MICO|nr:hypothetical protein [Microcella daejeonensis]WAB81882.1 hypothetical protein OVN18_02345 [Microcella daejeonensis]
MTALPTAAPATAARAARHRESRATAIAVVFAALVTAALAVGRAVLVPRFYYFDDTQTGAVGQWWELGERWVSGTWSILSPSQWQAGNFLAEGQWGLLSPLTTVIALLTRASDDMAVLATVVKISLLVGTSIGTVLLVRSFGASSPWSAVAGIATPLIGFTVYMDAPSWVTGLMTSALFPMAWWGLRRVSMGRNPWILLVSAGLLVTAGYVFGVLGLATLMIVTLLQHAVRSERASALRVLLAGLVVALLSIVIYLPAILTSGVSVRASTGIANDGFLNADLSDLLASSVATGSVSIEAWWGAFPGTPLQYIAWFLPLILLTLPAPRTTLEELAPAIGTATVMLLLVIGPSAVGPLRFPVRMMPYLGIALIVIAVVLMSRVRWPEVTTGRWVATAILMVAGGFAAWAQQPETAARVALSIAIGLLALATMRALATGRLRPLTRQSLQSTLAAVAVAATVLAVLPQMYWLRTSPLPDYGAEAGVQELSDVLNEAEGDTFVVGSALGRLRTGGDDVLAANLWYFSDAEVQNTYTVLQYREYAEDLCMDLRGSTCQAAFETLFEQDAATGERLADLLSLSSVLVLEEEGRPRAPSAPSGWSMVDESGSGWLFVRDDPVPPAGGIEWASTGATLRIDEQSETGLRATVLEDVDQGTIVTSRLAWPGYVVDGASLTDPHRGYLLTLDLEGARAGDVISVEFRPPAWPIVAISGLLSVFGGLAWCLAAAVLQLRSQRGGRAMRRR